MHAVKAERKMPEEKNRRKRRIFQKNEFFEKVTFS